MVAAHDKSDAVRDSAESWVIRHVNQLQKDEQFEQALEVAVRCENLMTSKKEHQMLRSNIYDAWARDLAKQKKWKESLGVYETALGKLPGDKLLQHNQEVTWGEWADSHMEAKQWKEAADVYAKAIKSLPDAGFDRNLAYLTQEWLKDVHTKDGIDGSAKTATALLKQFKSVTGVQKSAKNHFVRTATTLSAKKEYEQALKVIAQGEKLFDDDETLLNGARTVYDHWALSLKSQKKWQEAADVYSKGLKRYPKDSHLTNNATVLWDSWARTYFGSKDWDKAIDVYEKGLKVLPSSSLLKNNLNYCQQQAE
jgi:tetratricopeptide (TPR) repeat protein